MKNTTALATKKCKICRSEFTRYDTVQKYCIPCGIAIARQKREKAFKAETRQLRREFRKTDRPYNTGRATRACNAYILSRDSNEGCISCGIRTGRFHAGHFKTVGHGGNALRFHWANVNKQCAQCNLYKSGNVAEYRIRLVEKVGLSIVEFLERDHPPQKLTIEDLEQVTQWFKDLNRRASA